MECKPIKIQRRKLKRNIRGSVVEGGGNTPLKHIKSNLKKITKRGVGRPSVELEITDRRILNALKRHKGLQARAAEDLGVVEATITYHIKKSSTLQAWLKHLKEYNKDIGEANILRIMDEQGHDDHFQASKYYLNKQAKERGYGDQPIGTKEAPLHITITPAPSREEVEKQRAVELQEDEEGIYQMVEEEEA